MKQILYILMGAALFAGAQFGWQHMPGARANISPAAVAMAVQVSQGAMSAQEFEAYLVLERLLETKIADVESWKTQRDNIKGTVARGVEKLGEMPADTLVLRNAIDALVLANPNHEGIKIIDERRNGMVAMFQAFDVTFNQWNDAIN